MEQNEEIFTIYDNYFVGILKRVEIHGKKKFSLTPTLLGHEITENEFGSSIKLKDGDDPILLENKTISKSLESLPDGTKIEYFEHGKTVTIGDTIVEFEKIISIKIVP